MAIRTDHETIHDPNRALELLNLFHRDFTIPRHSEGFQKLIFIYPNDFVTALAVKSEIDEVLLRAEQAVIVDEPIIRTAAPVRWHRGRESRGIRESGGSWQARGGAGPYQSTLRGSFTSNTRREQNNTNRSRGADDNSWRGQGQTLSQSDVPPSTQHQNHNQQSYTMYQQTTQGKNDTAS